MKVIFFNVDGVLTGENFATKMWRKGISIYMNYIIDPVRIGYIKNIVKQTEAKLVLTSSWKFFPARMEALTKQLAVYGLEIYSQTPYAGLASHREDDIKLWFNSNEEDVDNFIILDTENDYGTLSDFLIETDYMTGLTKGRMKDAIDLLLKSNISVA